MSVIQNVVVRSHIHIPCMSDLGSRILDLGSRNMSIVVLYDCIGWCIMCMVPRETIPMSS